MADGKKCKSALRNWIARRRGIRDTADMNLDEDTIIEFFDTDERGFESHRRLHEYKSRSEIVRIVLVDVPSNRVILHSRVGDLWIEELREVTEVDGMTEIEMMEYATRLQMDAREK